MKPLKDMTAEELIKTDYHMHQTTELIGALRNKLKEAITPNPDEIHIVWSVEDVYGVAEGMGEDGADVPITLEQAREVLRRVKSSYDAETGVTWLSIEYAVQDVMEGK